MPFITPPPPPPPPEVLPEVEDEDTGISAGDMPEEDEDIGISAGDIPEDEEPEMEDRQPNLAGVGDMIKDETSLTTPQINLLSNLIHWASKARKEIGPEQLPVFLDIYATTGDLSPEVKDVILRLAEVTADPATGPGTPDRSYPVREEVALCIEINSLDGQIPAALKEKVHRLTDLILRQATNASKADIWSQLLLELHGILTGGGSSLHLVTAEGEAGSAQGKSEGESAGAAREQDAETAGEETSPADSAPISRNVLPARLRLVLPFENGSEQEVELGSFLISSTPAAKPGNGHK
jgi:hypothetical protein